MTSQQQDQRFMKMALALARRAEGRTSPNPMVGAVVVRDGEVVGRGYHRKAGTPHAEVVALAEAGELARGAELYVNLEPCNHIGRTGPCAQSIIAAGVRRVVVGMRDPHPLVDGRGIDALRGAGVEVTVGVLEERCCLLNRPFLSATVLGRPMVTFKTAVTLDGRVATRDGDARWVTGPEARKMGHRMRNSHDAIMVGSGTVLADDAHLTCRGVRGGRDPLRVVLDGRLRTSPGARVVTATAESPAGTLIYTGPRPDLSRVEALQRAGAQVVPLPLDGEHLDLARMLADLAGRGVSSVLLEGGPTVAGALWRRHLVDRVVAFVAPKFVGDPEARPVLRAGPLALMSEATELSGVAVRRVGQDVMISGELPLPRAGAEAPVDEEG